MSTRKYIGEPDNQGRWYSARTSLEASSKYTWGIPQVQKPLKTTNSIFIQEIRRVYDTLYKVNILR